MSNNIPVIEHATVTVNEGGYIIIQMDEGWVFWDENMYRDYMDEEGNIIPPAPEDINYYRYGGYPPTADFTKIHAVDETTVNPDQIFNKGNDHEIA